MTNETHSENLFWRELQRSITAWATESFGESTTLVTLRRANTELAELQKEIVTGNKNVIVEEAADVAIVAIRVFEIENFDIVSVLASLSVEDRSVPARIDAAIRGERQHNGPAIDQLVANANLTLAKAIHAYSFLDSREVAYQVALLFVDLMAITSFYNESLIDLVAGKMLINRERRWHKNGDGTGHHVRGVESKMTLKQAVDKALAESPFLETSPLLEDGVIEVVTDSAERDKIEAHVQRMRAAGMVYVG